MDTLYVPLWVKSYHSFLEGASSPEELVEEAKRLGLPALALTDRDGVYGVVRAHMKAKEVGIHLIIGSQVSVAHLEQPTAPALAHSPARHGPRRLCEPLPPYHVRPAAFPKGREPAKLAGGMRACGRAYRPVGRRGELAFRRSRSYAHREASQRRLRGSPLRLDRPPPPGRGTGGGGPHGLARPVAMACLSWPRRRSFTIRRPDAPSRTCSPASAMGSPSPLPDAGPSPTRNTVSSPLPHSAPSIRGWPMQWPAPGKSESAAPSQWTISVTATLPRSSPGDAPLQSGCGSSRSRERPSATGAAYRPMSRPNLRGSLP